MIPDNACTLRITAAAGTELAGASSVGTVIYSSPLTDLYTPKGFIGHADGPCLSPIVADHPLKPATDRRLGSPLHHQLANQVQAHP